jgi:hypothetical protein
MTDTIVIKQFPIDDASKTALLEVRMNIFYNDVDALAERLFTGKVSIGAWEESMKKMIRELGASTAAISKGGWDNMTFQDWGRLGPVLKEQYRFLHGYAEYIAANSDTVSIDYLKNRSSMYGRPSAHIISMMNAGIEISHLLPWLPGDMSTECDGNCRCYWALRVTLQTETTNTVEATWNLTPAEHCSTCLGRNKYVIVFDIDVSVPIPSTVGNM